MMSLALLMSLAGDPAAFPAQTQPPCPWDSFANTVLYPPRDAIIANDASIWILHSDRVQPMNQLPTLVVDLSTGEPVAVDVLETVLPMGVLQRFMPREPLDPAVQYELRTDRQVVPFRGGGPALTEPQAPLVERISSNTMLAYGESCMTFGAVVRIAPNDAQLFFAFDQGGFVGVSTTQTIIVEPINIQEMCLEIVAVDASGRMSASAEAGCVQPGQDYDYVGGGESGCACSGAERGGAEEIAPLSFALILMFLFLRTATIYRK